MHNEDNQHEILSYLKDHPVVVLSTINKDNQPHGAAVYAYASASDLIYFITKTETQKFKNIMHTPKVSITIADATDNSTFQASGRARVVEDAQTIETVMSNMVKVYAKSVDWLPPIAKIRAGPYEVLAIKIDHARLARFKDKHAGSKHIFKEG